MQSKPIGVFVVEDQKQISQGIVSMLRNISETYPLDIEAFAGGEAALARCTQRPPQIMLVDIVLERMTGLELIATLRERGYTVHIVIISSHDNFDYARQAIRTGVEEYILKPVQYDNLYRVVGRLTVEIEAGDRRTAQINAEKVLYASHLLLSRLEGLGVAHEWQELLDSLGLAFTLPLYRVGILAVGGEDTGALKAASQTIGKALRKAGALVGLLQGGPGRLVLLLNLAGDADAGVCEQLRQIVTARQVPLRCGLSTAAGDINLLPAAYREAATALEECGFRGRPFLCYNTVPGSTGQLVTRADYEELSLALRENSQSKVNAFLDAIFARLDAAAVSKERVTGEFAGIISHFHHSVLPGGDQNTEQFYAENVAQSLRACNSVFRMKLKIKDYLLAMLQDGHASYNHHVVNYIQLYIEKNYGNKVSLQDISGRLNISYSYASTVFSQNCGISFSEYLSSYRLGKAAALLRAPGARINEVASKCGFYDAQSFAKMFKRTYGTTPSEYRNTQK